MKSEYNALHLSRFSGSAMLLIGIIFWMAAGGQAMAMETGQGLSSGIRFGSGVDITDTAVGAHSVVAADLDGDGDMDIATTEENGGWGVIWFENPENR